MFATLDRTEVQTRVISMEACAAIVLQRESRLFDVEIVGLLDDPFLTESGMIIGQCCTDVEIPYLYRIDTNTARLMDVSRIGGQD